MKKYRISFDFDIYASTPVTALVTAVNKARELQFNDVLDEVPLPTAGMQGAPHTETALGWKCIFQIEEAE